MVKFCEYCIRNKQLSVKHFAGSNNLIEYDNRKSAKSHSIEIGSGS